MLGVDQSKSKQVEIRRTSIFGNSKKVISTPLEAISHRIQEAITGDFEPVELENKNLATDIEIVTVKVGDELIKVRRVFLCANEYQAGWVVDSDLTCCMICVKPYGWFRYRYHCRACGSLVCSSCSPYRAPVPGFSLLSKETGGSRTCVDCFGLKSEVFVNNRRRAAGSTENPVSPVPAAQEVVADNISDFVFKAGDKVEREYFPSHRLSMNMSKPGQIKGSQAVLDMERKEMEKLDKCEKSYK